ncbi:MutS-related protein [Pseudotenacibaculum haliotis]|uniref:DNA mismatch repair protein MutS n=1 Tax=Pseudotenacibaculum haliotis TaxID=1862138 RepID=A0ABW5LTG0_9FLAO
MNPVEFYTQAKATFETELVQLKKRLALFSTIRLAVFLLTGLGIYLTMATPLNSAIVFIVGAVVFGFLIVKHSDLVKKRDVILQKIEINRIELTVFEGKFISREVGFDFIDSNHAFSHDIDLFGERSFFNYINRTVTESGKQELANTLSSNEIDSIEKKQEAITELAKKVEWRQHFSALAGLVRVGQSSKLIADYILNYKTVFSKNLSKLPLLFSILSTLIIGLVAFQVIAFNILVLWFFIGLGIAIFFLKKTQKIYTDSNKAKDTFDQYYQLLQEIEKVEFSSEVLQEKRQKIQTEKQKASEIFERFAKILNRYDHRNNIFVALLGNALFLWDLKNACDVEKWIGDYKNVVQEWFEVVAFFDAQNSLANYCFNHPEYNFPKISQDIIIKATSLGHPLLKPESRVDNDFEIDQEKFYIITGANMAGKSTFLRTIGISIVMANVGLPVCAESFEYKPIKLITSMRTTDSLADNESYFYSELKRLKFIVDLMKDDEYFIILDEILKGTNSKDKASGSKKFVEKLVSFSSTGIIATHDVSLCELEKEYSQIENYFFEAEIKEDELFFDYILKQGICKNMNASFLLKKMEII